MKLIIFVLFALVLQSTYSAKVDNEKKLFDGVVNAAFCVAHNAKCTVIYAGAAAFCTVQKIGSQTECDNEYYRAKELCDMNKQVCGW